jgi:hypothetical protein
MRGPQFSPGVRLGSYQRRPRRRHFIGRAAWWLRIVWFLINVAVSANTFPDTVEGTRDFVS